MNANDVDGQDTRLQELRSIQYTELELIKLFVEICDKEKLIYYMLGGTMLGAVRHKGYIPWDDDADFGMPRGDYERFCKIASKYLPTGIRLSTFNGEAHYKYFGRLLSEKKKVKISGVIDSHESNVWIDIFPLDGLPEPSAIRLFHKIRLLVLRKLFNISNFNKDVPLHYAHRAWYNQIGVFLCRHIPIQQFFSASAVKKYLDKALKAYPYEKSTWNLNMMGAYKFKEQFKQSTFGEGTFYDFEGMKLRGPKDYETYLTQLYGDYMILPPESERNKHNTKLMEGQNV